MFIALNDIHGNNHDQNSGGYKHVTYNPFHNMSLFPWEAYKYLWEKK